MIRIESATPTTDRRILICLSDGRTSEVDLAPLLWGPVFESIAADDKAFRALGVDPVLGTIVWPNGADICPDTIISLAEGRHPSPVS